MAAMGAVVSSRLEAKKSVNEVAKPILLAPTKCRSCGSHEFRQHKGAEVCSYCRVPA